MHKTVLLFRHAKSDWSATYHQDHDRPLNSRGERASRAMGRWLNRTGPLPDLILCSTAVRARSTCLLASEAGEWTADVQYERGLYGASPQDLIHHLHEVTAEIQTIMLIGHQPAWSMTAALLSGQPVTEFPTASMARVDCEAEQWNRVVSGAGKLIWHQFPKRLSENYYKPGD